MSGIGRMAAAAGLVMVTAGCYEHTYTVGRGAPAGPIVYEEWQNHWLGGLIGHDTHELETVCPSGNATIHDEQSFLNGLVSALTGGDLLTDHGADPLRHGPAPRPRAV